MLRRSFRRHLPSFILLCAYFLDFNVSGFIWRGISPARPRAVVSRLAIAAEEQHLPLDGSATVSPTPVMPSPQFQDLAMSQLELLASSVTSAKGHSKIKSMALYLPQENSQTGQLEFLPAILYPHPSQDRVFIANDADSGVAPSLPRTLTTLPGFAHATSLLPDYPMVTTGGGIAANAAGVGVVEEVMCDLTSGAAALSIPLFAGSQTVGVLLVSPRVPRARGFAPSGPRGGGDGYGGSNNNNKSCWWTAYDCDQVQRAAKSLSMALSMDSERNALLEQNRRVSQALYDSLHQVKNPLQAMRTYGKLLQRHLAYETTNSSSTTDMRMMDIPQLQEMAENLLIQSDRLTDRLKPVDSIAQNLLLGGSSMESEYPLLESSKELVHLPTVLPWERETLEYARTSTEVIEFGPKSSSSSSSGDAISNAQPTASPNGGRGSLKAPKNKPSKSESGMRYASPLVENMELEMSFLDDVLDPVVRAFRGIAAEQDIGFEFLVDGDELSGVTICSQALQEAMVNIIDNAFTYGRPVGNRRPQIRIRLFSNAEHMKPGVTILVEDNGPGVPEADRENIFHRGYRSPAVEATDGSGIGLDIARTLIEAMGGTLRLVMAADAYSDALPGAIFEIVLFRAAMT